MASQTAAPLVASTSASHRPYSQGPFGCRISEAVVESVVADTEAQALAMKVATEAEVVVVEVAAENQQSVFVVGLLLSSSSFFSCALIKTIKQYK